ncbi:MAG: transposase [Pseudomonadota bacterium]|uniref:transposase n=1 Tax=unclassified Sphingomonas TaxID=196159 RepID=UPI00335CBC61
MHSRRTAHDPPPVRSGGARSDGSPYIADPDLMRIRRCTVEHPFGTIKRMSGGGRFLTRKLRAVKAEAALSILAFNLLHAMNAFGHWKMTGVA